MRKSNASADLKQLSPALYEQTSKLYCVLAARIRPEYRTGPGLNSEENFCDLLLTILSDAKDMARIPVAAVQAGEVWFGFYPGYDDPAVEFVQKKNRAEYGTQVSRWHLASASQIANYPSERLKMLFSGYSA